MKMKQVILGVLFGIVCTPFAKAQIAETCITAETQLKAPSAEAKAYYLRPKGTYLFGLGLSSANTRGFFVPAYVPMTFENRSENATSYLWQGKYPNDQLYIDSRVEKPEIVLPTGVVPMPLLTARGSNLSTYIYGPVAGHDSIIGRIHAGDWDEATNLDWVGFKQAALTTKPGNYVFGTKDTLALDAIGNLFDKPLQPAIVRSMYVAFGKFQMDTVGIKATGDSILTMRVIRLVPEGNGLVMKDTIATASASVLNVNDLTFTNYNCYTLDFRFDDAFVVNDILYYELSGFYGNPHLSFGVISNSVPNKYEENAYVTVHHPNGMREMMPSSLYTYRLTNNAVAFRASLFFALDMMFPVCHTDLQDITCGSTSGSVSIPFETTYAQNTPNPQDVYPVSFELQSDWARVDSVGYREDRSRVVHISYDALPEMTGRSAKLVVKAFGMADQEILVKQGIVSGLDKLHADQMKVINDGTYFEASYPAGYKVLEVYSISGQKLFAYQLPDTGTFEFSHAYMQKGIYVFQFKSPQGNKTLKVIK